MIVPVAVARSNVTPVPFKPVSVIVNDFVGSPGATWPDRHANGLDLRTGCEGQTFR